MGLSKNEKAENKINAEIYIKSLGYTLLNEYVNKDKMLKLIDKYGYKYCITLTGLRKHKNAKLQIISDSNEFNLDNLKNYIKLNCHQIIILKFDGKCLEDNIIIKNIENNYKYNISIRYFLQHKVFESPILINNSYNNQNIKLWLKINFPKLKLIKDYEGVFDKLLLIDNNGYKYSVSFDNLYRNRVNQSIVSNGNIFSIENIHNYIIKNNIQVKLLSDKYIEQKNKLVFDCLKCGNEWICSWNNFYKERSCGTCALLERESEISRELKKYLKNKYKAQEEYRVFKNPKTNRWLPFDIYIEKYKLFIEVNGLQHYYFIKKWHKTLNGFEESKYRDKIKKEYAEKNGKLVYIDLRKIKTINLAISKIEKEILKYV